MDRFAVNCSRSIHTKVYYCTFISHYDRHQRVLARWNDAIVVLFVFVVVSSFFLNFFSFPTLGLPFFPFPRLCSTYHPYLLEYHRNSSNRVCNRSRYDHFLWFLHVMSFFSSGLYGNHHVVGMFRFFFCVLPFLAFPCSSWFFFSTALLCTPITSTYRITIRNSHSVSSVGAGNNSDSIFLSDFVVFFTISVHEGTTKLFQVIF